MIGVPWIEHQISLSYNTPNEKSALLLLVFNAIPLTDVILTFWISTV
jgi:hypothetical protein